MTLIDGKQLSEDIKKEIAIEVNKLTFMGKRPPHLAVVIVGNNTASQTYVRHKVKACEEVGFKSTKIELPETITQDELLQEIEKLNTDSELDGFIVQLPLPKHINEQTIIEKIAPEKDVDGFHPVNLGRTLLGLPAYNPATPKGIMEIFRRYKIDTYGKHVVILGRSNIVGKPMAAMLVNKGFPGNATVTVCHSKTQNLKEHTLSADIIIAAIGKANFVTADMIKENAVVIDVGINSIPDSSKKSGYRLVGDVDFDAVKDKASYITPVPGGVGPMTVVSLLQNTLLAYKKVIYK